jgi:peptidoglycan/xylan/chitin deacetylase (PgdA/CDA1 family)
LSDVRSPRIAVFALLTAFVVGGLTGCGHPGTRRAGTFVTPSVGASTSQTAARPGALPAFASPPAPQPHTVAAGGPAAPILSRIPVTQKVAFLTMDDGQVRLPEAPALMRAAHIPFTMFLIAPVAAHDPAFFKEMEAAGGVIEDHTITHPSMRGKPYAEQRHQICGARDQLQAAFGVHPRFFRPPYGNYDTNTLKAVHDCGLQAAFNWSETVNNGKVYYQTPTHKIQPGDIILMHFRPAFVRDVEAALKAIHDSGLTPALLEDYIR